MLVEHRNDHGPGAQDSVVDDGEVGDVGEHQADAVSRPDALALQQARNAGARLVEQRVIELDVVELQGRTVALALRPFREDSGQVLVHFLAPIACLAHPIRPVY
jgi:hypothetical protein